jgi:L-alanine-DL-glutamate epimerase-like enolase superfamily enzyme
MKRRAFLLASATSGIAASRAAATERQGGDGPPDRCGPLPIESVRIALGDSPCDVRLSSGAIPRYPFGLVRIRAAGTEGVGEGHVRDIAPLAAAVRGLVGQDARGLDNLLPPNIPTPVGEAISIALHDLVARILGIPFHVLIGGAARGRVPLMPCIFANEPRAAGERAAEFAKAGFPGVKFKFFGEPARDVAALEAVRGATPAGRIVLADANGGYRDPQAVRDLLPRCAAAGLDIVEDPLASAGDDPFGDTAGLRGLTRVKIMLDIGVRKEGGLAKAIRRGGADVINLHPNQQGSVSRTLRRAAAAETMGVPVWMGGTGSFGVQAAAWQQMAAVISTEMPCGEVGGSFDHGFSDDIVEAPYPLEGGAAILPDTPGLGVAIDEAALQRMTLAEDHFDRPA